MDCARYKRRSSLLLQVSTRFLFFFFISFDVSIFLSHSYSILDFFSLIYSLIRAFEKHNLRPDMWNQSFFFTLMHDSYNAINASLHDLNRYCLSKKKCFSPHMLVKPDNNIHKEGTKLFNHYIVDWTHWTSNTENHFYMISISFLFFSISRCVNQSILTLIWNSQKKTSEYVEIRKFVICIHRLLVTEIVANLICDVVTEIGRTMMNIFIAVLVFYVTWIHSINVFSCFTCATKIKLLLLIEEDHHGNHVYVWMYADVSHFSLIQFNYVVVDE